MTGYEKSPDYGGPEPDFHFEIPLAIIFVLVILIALVWTHH